MPPRSLTIGMAALGLLAILGTGTPAAAATQTTSNETLSVTYDDAAKTFAVAEKAGGKVFF